MKQFIAATGIAALLLLPGISRAQEDPAAEPKPAGVLELRQQANEAYAQQNYTAFRDALKGLHALRPYNGDYMAMLVTAHALVGDKRGAYDVMLRMQQQGLSRDFDAVPDAESIRGTQAYEYVNNLMVRAGEPAGEASVLFELPADVLLPTSIDWDPGREAWLVGDARDGAVRAVSAQGEVRELLRANSQNGLWSIFGLMVDAENNRLWLSSSASDTYRDFDAVDAGRSALFEFTLDTLEPVRRYPVPVDGRPHRLGDLARTPGGDIYVVDTILPILYRLEAGADRLQPFLASADMVSMRGVALSGNGGKLYIADYELGIMVIDLAGQQAYKLTVPETLNMGGIEGLFYRDGHLVMIQNGNRPQRIMRLKLDPEGSAVENVAALAVAQPFFDYPNFGTVVDDTLYFFANSHWVRQLSEPEPIRLAATNVDEAPDIVPPDVQKFREDYERRARERLSREGEAGSE